MTKMKNYLKYRKHFEKIGIEKEEDMRKIYEFLYQLAEIEIEFWEGLSPEEKEEFINKCKE